MNKVYPFSGLITVTIRSKISRPCYQTQMNNPVMAKFCLYSEPHETGGWFLIFCTVTAKGPHTVQNSLGRLVQGLKQGTLEKRNLTSEFHRVAKIKPSNVWQLLLNHNISFQIFLPLERQNILLLHHFHLLYNTVYIFYPISKYICTHGGMWTNMIRP